MVCSVLTASRQPLGGALLEVDRRGARANDYVIADDPLVPERLDGRLPAADGRDLVEQEQTRGRAFGQIEGSLDGRGQLREMPSLQEVEREIGDRAWLEPARERTLHEQLQVGALTDLAGSAQNVNSGHTQVQLGHKVRWQAHRLSVEQLEVWIGALPCRIGPPRILTEDLGVR